MKHTKWVGLVTALAFPLLSVYGQTPEAQPPGAPGQSQAAAPASLSPGAAEVVRLAGSGVGDDVVVAYIQNSQAVFNLSADDVLYLKDIGLSPQVTTAMLSHDGTLRNQGQQYAPAAPAPTAPAPVAPAASAPATAYPPVTTAPPAAAEPPPAYVSSAPADVSYFYNDLAPYGTWVSLEGYGWCWQPRTVLVSPGWRPYCDGGNWVYTDAGWYWQSVYSWGWAPFHYGRWYLHPRSGWVWMPDRVWGPAWVTWRAAGDSCGWAPLPPHATFDVRLGWRYNGVAVGANFGFGLGINAFAFVALGDFCNHDLAHHCLPPARVTSIYRQTTVLNNYVVKNNTVVHQGIPLERVTAASRVPVSRATIHDVPAGMARMPGRTQTVVYRAQPQAPARPVNMVAQKVDAQHPVIQHAPIAAVRTAPASSFSRSGSAPAAAPRQPAPRSPQPAPTSATPKASPWSGGAKPAASPQSQSTSRTYQPGPTAPPAAAAPRAPENWKQGVRAAPSYRSDAGLPAYNSAHSAAQSPSAGAQTLSQAQNSHVYYPKSARQASEIHSLPPSEQSQTASPSSPGRGQGSRSGKNQ